MNAVMGDFPQLFNLFAASALVKNLESLIDPPTNVDIWPVKPRYPGRPPTDTGITCKLQRMA